MKKINIIGTTLAASAGMLVTACSSMHHHEDRASYQTGGYSSSGDQSSVYESSGTENNTSQNYSSAQSGQNDLVIPLHEEQVNIGKRTVDAGQVTIRKIVTTETVNQPVELRHETVVIDREGGNGQRASYSSTGQNSSSQSYNSQAGAGWQPSANIQDQASTSDQSGNYQSNSGLPSNQQIGSPRALEQSEQQRASTENEPAGAAIENQNSSSSSFNQSSSSTSGSASSNISSSNSSDQSNQSSGFQSSGTQASGTPFQEQTYTIHLQAEQPMIEKTIVQTGRVVAHKNNQMQQQNVTEQVRREDVQLDKNGVAAQNVEVRGNFNTAQGQVNEPSGAERHDLNKSDDKDSHHDSDSDKPDQK